MYCDRCGAVMQHGQQFCGSCGKPFAQAPGPARRGRVAGNLTVLAILWIVYSAMHLAGGVFIHSMMRGLPGPWWTHTAAHGWPAAHVFLPGMVFPFLGGMTMLAGVLGIVAGAGLLGRRPWARTMAIVFGCLALASFPLGTALGIYTLWVLGSSESGREYRAAA